MSASASPSAPGSVGDTSPLSMMRTVSSEGAAFAHPRPDLQTTQGAYTGNVGRLEDHAERMSITGSDIQDEIRKLQLEQKLSDSRRSSLRLAQMEEPTRVASQRSRAPSYSSHNNSIVGTNQAARWGGYSPNAFIGSPVGSITSGSWSQPSVPLHRSVSKPSAQLDILTEPSSQASMAGFESPKRPSFEALPSHLETDATSQTSFAAELKAIAQDIHEQLDDSQPQTVQPLIDPALDTPDKPLASPFAPDFPDRPPSAGSTNTYQQAQQLFTDFDGVHYAPSTRGPSGGSRMSLLDGGGRRASGMPMQAQRDTWVQPPPNSNMVYYPAPVPMMLNLPQKLSSRPAAAVQAKKREQMLSMMAPQDKQAAPWLEKGANDSTLSLGNASDGKTGNTRSAAGPKSIAGMAGLPPQLRATMFFDAQPLHHEVEVKSDSAVVTLDSILEASASAPVGAFTDHPFAGHQGAKIYKRETVVPRRSTSSMLDQGAPDRRKSLISLAGNATDKLDKDQRELKKRRSSFTMLFGKRSHSTNEPAAVDDDVSGISRRDSRLTMRSASGGAIVNGDIYHGEAIDEEEERSSPALGEEAPLRQSRVLSGDPERESEDEEDQFHDAVADHDAEDEVEEDLYAPPTTLLAELQKRKAQQKSRNKTAATAFPNGMHSTLLELDAVEEMERKMKLKGRVALAWEDPDIKAQIEDEQNDDDVPLGMLYQKQNGVMKRISRANMETNAALAEQDWNRPLGLIEQREHEQSESLAQRRARLKGLAPRVLMRRDTAFGGLGSQSQVNLPTASQLNLATQVDANGISVNAAAPNLEQQADDEDDDVPLTQHAQRLKTRNTLSMAISDIEGGRESAQGFSSDLLGHFGAEEKPAEARNEAQDPQSGTPDLENETLGQRRARLRAEAEKAAQAQRPAISRRTSASSGDLLNGARASTILPSTSPSPGLGGERPKSGLGLAGLRPTRSMADLLAAHPLTANAHSARKVSDDQLKHQMPAGSLLAQNDVLQRRNKQRLSSVNNLGTGIGGGGIEGPLVGQVDERKRRISSGNFGGLLDNSGLNQRRPSVGNFDRGLIGDQDRRQSGMVPTMQQQQPAIQPQLPMSPMGIGMMNPYGMPMYPSMPNMQQYPYGNGMGNMSVYGLPQQPSQLQQQNPYFSMHQQQMPSMGQGMPMYNNMQSMSTPNFMAHQRPPMLHQQTMPAMGRQGQQTYAAFAQQQMGGAGAAMRAGPGGMGMGFGMDEESFSPEQRDMVKRWAQGIS